jgi:hypothetical protein
MLNVLPVVLAMVGIFLGYRLAHALYEYIIVSFPRNKARSTENMNAFVGVNSIVKERYKLGVARPSPEFSLFESDYSTNENIAISDFLFKMNELGLHYIYLKPKNNDQLIYHATCLGDEKAFRTKIYVKELD